MVFLEAHSYGYLIGLVFFALHCVILGYLVIRSGFLPRILGVLLMVAAAGYLADSFSRTLLATYDDYATLFLMGVFIPAFIAEGSFCLWLLLKGVDMNPSPETAAGGRG
jgi:hypothetical protein